MASIDICYAVAAYKLVAEKSAASAIFFTIALNRADCQCTGFQSFYSRTPASGCDGLLCDSELWG